MTQLVSVIIPTFNRKNSLMRALESVRQQSYTNIEIIIVDDASTDGSDRVIFEISDDRIRYLRLTVNGGASNARNVGIEIAEGEFITFLDSDDEYLPEKIEKQVARLHSAGETFGVVSCGRIDKRNGIAYRTWVPKREGEIIDLLLSKRIVGAGTPFLMVRSALIRQHKIRFNKDLPAGQDWDFLTKVCLHSQFCVVQEPLVVVHHHGGDRVFSYGSAARAASIQYQSFLEQIKRKPANHANFIFYVSKYIFLNESSLAATKFIQQEFAKHSLKKKTGFYLWLLFYRFCKADQNISRKVLHVFNQFYFT